MRIAMISEHASPLAALGDVDAGGQNAHVAELATTLARDGHQVCVYTRRDHGDQPEQVTTGAGFTVVHVPAGPPRPLPKDDLLPYMGSFADWLAQRWFDPVHAPDIVHAHFWMSGLAGLDAGERTGVPVVLTYHALGTVKRRYQGNQDTSPPERIACERLLGNRVDRVIAQCRDEVGELTALGVPRSRICVIPSGVDSARFSPEGPAVRRDSGRHRLLTVGRLVPRKGFQDIIAALRWVPDAELVLAGGPPGEAAHTDRFGRWLHDLARQTGVADRVRLVGAVPREDMPAWYRSADLFVTAPWYEPFGLTAPEAMACGRAVVATDVGGLQDTVIDRVTGELVPPRDPRRLGRVLRRLLNEPWRRLAYGAAGRDRVTSVYSWEHAARRLSAVYTTLAGQTTGAVA